MKLKKEVLTMENFNPLYKNPFKTRNDMILALKSICEPLAERYSPGKARLVLSTFSAHYTDDIAQMEGFSRILWGLVPLLAGGEATPLWDICLEGIRNGTDPSHPEYWGDIKDYDQRIVEMAVYGYALAFIPEKVWAPLDDTAKRNLSAWLYQINSHEPYDCNWLFFRVIVNIALKKLGEKYSQEKLDSDLARLDKFYIKDGWYADGQNAHCDYYIPWAFHFYSLIYAIVMKDEDKERAEIFKKRAAEFAKHFINWFSPDGSSLPYGRSLTYRFAQNAFFGALVCADASPFPLGVVKGIILRNFRYWAKQPVFTADGILTVGYGYPNLIMAESYNSPGSPYWGLKSFMPLALPEDHPFWTVEELPLPDLAEKTVQPEPSFVICRENNHVVAFNAGSPFTNDHNHTVEKYEKFAYSNIFGFSVQRGDYDLDQGAFDSMLALSECDEFYRVKRMGNVQKLTEDEIIVEWKPWKDVTVKTHIFPALPWHIRVHIIETPRKLVAAEGGFALGIKDDKSTTVSTEGDGIAASTMFGTSGILPLYGSPETTLVHPNPDTNLINSRTVLPTVKYTIEPGKVMIASAIYGSSEKNADIWAAAPYAVTENGHLYIYQCRGGKLICDIPLI